MKNDLSKLPWRTGQFHQVENYWEATGVLASMKAGIDPASVRRPLRATQIEMQMPGITSTAAEPGSS